MKNLLDSIWSQVPVITGGKVISTSQLGIIAKKSDGDESWKAYIGVLSTESKSTDINQEAKDIDMIVKMGAQLSEVHARMWFPLIELKYRD